MDTGEFFSRELSTVIFVLGSIHTYLTYSKQNSIFLCSTWFLRILISSCKMPCSPNRLFALDNVNWLPNDMITLFVEICRVIDLHDIITLIVEICRVIDWLDLHDKFTSHKTEKLSSFFFSILAKLNWSYFNRIETYTSLPLVISCTLWQHSEEDLKLEDSYNKTSCFICQ